MKNVTNLLRECIETSKAEIVRLSKAIEERQGEIDSLTKFIKEHLTEVQEIENAIKILEDSKNGKCKNQKT